MKAAIGSKPFIVVSRAIHGGTALAKIGKARRIDVRNCLADQMGLQQRTQVENLLDAICAQSLDKGAVVGRRGDPAFCLERTEGLPYWHPRYAKMLRQRNLIELGAVGKCPLLNRLAQQIGNPIRNAVPLFESTISGNGSQRRLRHSCIPDFNKGAKIPVAPDGHSGYTIQNFGSNGVSLREILLPYSVDVRRDCI